MNKLRWATILWLALAGAGIGYLAYMNWHLLMGHKQAIVAIAVILGLIVGVFLLAAWLAPKKEEKKEDQPGNERLKLQNEIRTAIFQAIAGLAVFVGAFIAWQQLQSDRSESQTTNTLASQEQVAQAYSQAVNELANNQVDIRIGGMYALQQIFRAGQNPNTVPTNPIIIRIRPAVFGLLTAYIRTHASSLADPPACDRSVDEMPSLSARSPDVQVALNVLGTRGYGAPGEPNLFLEHTDLRNADLFGSFDDTDFSYSDLAGADLRDTDLLYTNFMYADLCGANLTTIVNYNHADFEGAAADSATKFPTGFNPKAYGIIMKH